MSERERPRQPFCWSSCSRLTPSCGRARERAVSPRARVRYATRGVGARARRLEDEAEVALEHEVAAHLHDQRARVPRLGRRLGQLQPLRTGAAPSEVRESGERHGAAGRRGSGRACSSRTSSSACLRKTGRLRITLSANALLSSVRTLSTWPNVPRPRKPRISYFGPPGAAITSETDTIRSPSSLSWPLRRGGCGAVGAATGSRAPRCAGVRARALVCDAQRRLREHAPRRVDVALDSRRVGGAHRSEQVHGGRLDRALLLRRRLSRAALRSAVRACARARLDGAGRRARCCARRPSRSLPSAD